MRSAEDEEFYKDHVANADQFAEQHKILQDKLDGHKQAYAAAAKELSETRKRRDDATKVSSDWPLSNLMWRPFIAIATLVTTACHHCYMHAGSVSCVP